MRCRSSCRPLVTIGLKSDCEPGAAAVVSMTAPVLAVVAEEELDRTAGGQADAEYRGIARWFGAGNLEGRVRQLLEGFVRHIPVRRFCQSLITFH